METLVGKFRSVVLDQSMHLDQPMHGSVSLALEVQTHPIQHTAFERSNHLVLLLQFRFTNHAALFLIDEMCLEMGPLCTCMYM